jgi:beta-lactamase class A
MLRIFTICCLMLTTCLACRTKPGTASQSTVSNPLILPDSANKLPDTMISSARTDSLMEALLNSSPELFKDILANRQNLRVQVIYTQIDRNPQNEPIFTPYYFNENAADYFYPASTVKMPIALLSLEKIKALNLPGLNKNSVMITGADFSSQTPVFNDPTALDGAPSVAQYIKKIFLVSDNDAFNRLYELIGQEAINRQLQQKGYSSANIYHRLSVAPSEEENRTTNPIQFTDGPDKQLYAQPQQRSGLVYAKRKNLVGSAYYAGDQLVQQPLDFSAKNRFGLADLTKCLRAILFPTSLPARERFDISEEDRLFVLKYMSEFPNESISPEYPSGEVWPTYCKFLYYGSDSLANTAEKNLRIFNKVGDAYGFLTDVAYIVDFDKDIEFMLSATIYCNSDGVLNDDKYDYDSIGYPFMKNLGRLIYNFETSRKRMNMPDLSAFKLQYDKRK